MSSLRSNYALYRDTMPLNYEYSVSSWTSQFRLKMVVFHPRTIMQCVCVILAVVIYAAANQIPGTPI